MILQNDFKRQWRTVGTAATAAFQRVGSSGWYVLGQEVEAFEAELARRWGIAHAVGVANGMDALEIGLRGLGIQSGDRVLTTPLSAFATTLAIMRTGATAVFVDTDELGQIDLAQCRRVLAENASIRFMVPVHLFGFCLDLPELAQLKADFNLRVIEDCAQAIGASSGGIKAGAVGDAAATSFYPTKNLGAMGDGGALLTNDPALDARARSLRNYGQASQYVHDDNGMNSRLDEMQAAILHQALLPRLEEWTVRRRGIAQRYLEEINHPAITLLRPSSRMEPVWHLFPILLEPQMRVRFRDGLREAGIITGLHYPSLITEQQALKKHGSYEIATGLRIAASIVEREVSLPIHPFLTENEIAAVIAACNQWHL